MTHRPGAAYSNEQKSKRAASVISLPLADARSVELPEVLLVRVLLIQRVEGEDGRFRSRASSSRVDANHCIFRSTEAANAGLVPRERNGEDRIAYVGAAHNR